MSEIAKYADGNPDPTYPGCRNTGELGDGVIFPGFEPYLGHVGFIGRSSIIEAVGELFAMTVDEVTAALEEGTPRQKAALEKKDKQIDALNREIAEIRRVLTNVLEPPDAVESEIR